MKINDILIEASYPGNIGAMEVIQFFGSASKDEKEEFNHYINTDQTQKAWDLVQHVTNTQLVFQESERVSDPVSSITISRQGKQMSFPVMDTKVINDYVWHALVKLPNNKKWFRIDLKRGKVHTTSGMKDRQIIYVGEYEGIDRRSAVA